MSLTVAADKLAAVVSTQVYQTVSDNCELDRATKQPFRNFAEMVENLATGTGLYIALTVVAAGVLALIFKKVWILVLGIAAVIAILLLPGFSDALETMVGSNGC